MKSFSYLLVICCAFILSCRLDVPIIEMVKAKKAIKRAYEVKADKYDPEKLRESESRLYRCHDYIKISDMGKAKKEAIDSYDLAIEAINKSLPLLSEETLAEAMKIYHEAEDLYAEAFAKDEFKNADKHINEADSLKAEKLHWESYLNSSMAVNLGNEAKRVSQEKIPSLSEQIARHRAAAEDLKKKQLDQTAVAEIQSAENLLTLAEEGLKAGHVKKAVGLIAEAEDSIRKISFDIIKQSVMERITRLRSDIELFKKEKGSDIFIEEVNQLASMLNESESMLEQLKTQEAILRVNEAEQAFVQVKRKTLKTIAANRLDSVTRLLEKTRSEDKGSKHTNAIQGAESTLNESRLLFDKEEFDGSIKKSNEAERSLLSIGIEGEKGTIRETETADHGSAKIYTVKLNKKNRDCLWRIAMYLYSDARLWPLIYAANRHQIKDPDLIFPGQEFTIPAAPLKAKSK